MRVGIDANPILGERGGVGWHTYHLLRALLDLKEEVEFLAYVRAGASKRSENDMSAWEGYARLHWVEAGRATMHWRGALDQLDLYHGTNFKMQTKGRHGAIVTVHDLWLDRHPKYSKKFFGQAASFLRTRRRAWGAARVLTVSQHSSRDIQELYGLPQDRISVIPNGVSGDFRPEFDPSRFSKIQSRYGIPSGPYFLFLGGADPRKNHTTLFRAYAQSPAFSQNHYLVVVGNSTHRFGSVIETGRLFGILDRIVCTGPVSLDDLRLLYSHADLFVFPSRYEGFGLPVLEAMACGTPVIASDTTALPEVAGDAAILVNPEDPAELAQAMVRVLEDSNLRQALRTRGFERARLFSWERAARQTLSVYREVCR